MFYVQRNETSIKVIRKKRFVSSSVWYVKYTGEYFTRKSIFCQGPQKLLSFFAKEIFGNFLTKFPHFWTICNKNAKFWIIWQNNGKMMIKIGLKHDFLREFC